MGTRLVGPPAASGNRTPLSSPPSVHLFVPSFSVSTPSEAQFPIVSVLPPIVEQQGPFLYPVGNDNEMSTAGDVGRRTGGTHHRKRDLGGGGLRTGTDIPQEDRMGERKLKLGPPQYSML